MTTFKLGDKVTVKTEILLLSNNKNGIVNYVYEPHSALIELSALVNRCGRTYRVGVVDDYGTKQNILLDEEDLIKVNDK